MESPVRRVTVARVGSAGPRTLVSDRAVTEEPLEIRVNGEPFAVTMRTPGADVELAAGFLFSERVIRSARELGTIEQCRTRHRDELENVVQARVIGAALRRLPGRLGERRRVTTSSSCGLCGRRAIDSLKVEAPRVTARWTIDKAILTALPDRLRRAQAIFEETGGLHAAGLFTPTGELDAFAEDIGRHNAVDKILGRMIIAERLPLGCSILVVSGRASFEIAQKAFLAGVPIVAAVSAPSTLAIDLARRAGMTLVGFVRNDRFNIYTHERRVEE